MRVSVIIPVYNAERFLEQAVASVLRQPEVQEIFLVDDGSTDNSMQLSKRLAAHHPKTIKVLCHPDGKNHGPAATRNLGLASACCEYIAFLDADDLYLENRFTETIKAFDAHASADGVYETVRMLKEDHHLSESITRRAGGEFARLDCPNPNHLFAMLARAKNGYIHLNGLTLRRESIDSSLYFDPTLIQCQDTDFMLRLSARRRLYGAPMDRVVAYRRVHDTNRVFDVREAMHYSRVCMRKCARNGFYGLKDMRAKWSILNRMARASVLVVLVKRWNLPVTPFRLLIIAAFLIANPRVFNGLIRSQGSPSIRHRTHHDTP